MYPLSASRRDRWILERRGPRTRLDPRRPYAFLVESEFGPHGALVDAATVFLTNRECPFRCVMCDLWRNTLEQTVPPGAIAEQIAYALERLPTAQHLKLYNAGSFFDPRAIPPAEYPEIARLCAPFERVIVECHPAFVGERVLEFRALIGENERLRGRARGRARSRGEAPPEPRNRFAPRGERLNASALEVAMGLETVHPQVLERLNKRMTLESFRRAAEFLTAHGIALRVFILVRPPWLSEAEGVEWAKRSLDFAFDCGASVCSLIPTRAGNGAMEALAGASLFGPPSLRSLEAALEYGLQLGRGRVFADLWDAERSATCAGCIRTRMARLAAMNRTQQAPPPAACSACEEAE